MSKPRVMLVVDGQCPLNYDGMCEHPDVEMFEDFTGHCYPTETSVPESCPLRRGPVSVVLSDNMGTHPDE